MLKLLFLGLKKEKIRPNAFLHYKTLGISWFNSSSNDLIIITVSSVYVINLIAEI